MCTYRATSMPVLTLATAVVMLVTCPIAGAQTSAISTTTIRPSAPSSPQVYDLPTQGPPTTNVLIQGAGFDPLTAIDVYFDSTKLASTTTDKNGAFGNGVITATGATFTRLQVPANALPGQHTITAQERVGQKSAQKSFLVQTDWAQFGFNEQHTAFNPYENVLTPGIVGNLVVDWKYKTASNVADAPAVANGVVYIPSDDGYLYALSANTGALVWKSGFRGNFSSPAVANGAVYAGSVDYSNAYIDAFNASTGDLIWKSSAVGPPTGAAIPTVANGVVYIGSMDNNVYALDATTGAILWKYATQGQLYSSPAVANGVAYIGSEDHYVYALNARTGDLVWRRVLPEGIASSASVANGILYIGDTFPDDQLYALDAGTGDLLWTYGTGATAVANGVVYVSTSALYALDAKTGTFLWEFNEPGLSSPTVANGVVYVGAEDGRVFAVDATTGELLWQYATGQIAGPSPAVVNGIVFIGSGDENVYAFHLPNQ